MDVTLKHQHKQVWTVYLIYSRLQNKNMPRLTKRDPLSRARIYLGNSTFHSRLVDLVLNPESGLLYIQYHVVFDDDSVTVPFMREGKIIPKWLDLVQQSFQEIKPDSIKLNNTWFTPYLKDNPSEVLYEVQTKMSTFSMHALI